jgi:hypothetical protein
MAERSQEKTGRRSLPFAAMVCLRRAGAASVCGRCCCIAVAAVGGSRRGGWLRRGTSCDGDGRVAQGTAYGQARADMGGGRSGFGWVRVCAGASGWGTSSCHPPFVHPTSHPPPFLSIVLWWTSGYTEDEAAACSTSTSTWLPAPPANNSSPQRCGPVRWRALGSAPAL